MFCKLVNDELCISKGGDLLRIIGCKRSEKNGLCSSIKFFMSWLEMNS